MKLNCWSRTADHVWQLIRFCKDNHHKYLTMARFQEDSAQKSKLHSSNPNPADQVENGQLNRTEKDTEVHSSWSLLYSWVPVGLVYLLSHGAFSRRRCWRNGSWPSWMGNDGILVAGSKWSWHQLCSHVKWSRYMIAATCWRDVPAYLLLLL